MSEYTTQSAGVSLRQHLALLGEHRRFIILFCLSAVVTAVALTYVYSERYQAATTIFYRQAEVTLMKAREHEAFGSPASSTPFKVISKTVRELVGSEAILRPVVEKLNLHIEDEDKSGPWYSRLIDSVKDFARAIRDDAVSLLKYGRIIEEDPVVGAIKTLASNVEVINKDSYVFIIRVRDKNAQRVALVADAVAEELVGFLRDQSIRAGENKAVQLETLMESKAQVIDSHRTRMESMLKENEIVAISQEIEHGVARRSDLQAELDTLNSEISKAEARLATIRRMLDNKSRSSGGSYIQPEDKKRLESERLFTELELEGLRANRRRVNQSITDLSELLGKLPGLELEYDLLEIERDGSKRDWIQLRDAMQDAVVRSKQTQSEATVLHKATVPTAPVSPVKLYHVGLALLLSFMAAISIVFVFSFLRIDLFFETR